jgi:hypothetical protein
MQGRCRSDAGQRLFRENDCGGSSAPPPSHGRRRRRQIGAGEPDGRNRLRWWVEIVTQERQQRRCQIGALCRYRCASRPSFPGAVDQQTQRQPRQRVVRPPVLQRLREIVHTSRRGGGGSERVAVAEDGVLDRLRQEAPDVLRLAQRRMRQCVERSGREAGSQRMRREVGDERVGGGDGAHRDGAPPGLRPRKNRFARRVGKRVHDPQKAGSVIASCLCQRSARGSLGAETARCCQCVERVEGRQRNG